MIELTLPYWYMTDQLADLDFNREIVEPGVNEAFPDGAVGIRVDASFWVVAALPLEEYRIKTIQEIVAIFWPSYVEQATYAPDYNTPEYHLYVVRNEVSHYRQQCNDLQDLLRKQNDELDRFKTIRPDLSFRQPKRVEMTKNYFVRQYEHLLVAFAHPGSPKKDLPGVCSICNLLISDRIHQAKWIEKNKSGYSPDMEFSFAFEKEDSFLEDKTSDE